MQHCACAMDSINIIREGCTIKIKMLDPSDCISIIFFDNTHKILRYMTGHSSWILYSGLSKNRNHPDYSLSSMRLSNPKRVYIIGQYLYWAI